ncbi:MAG: hypothetical protein VKI82_16060 [Leptolyngbya sp.]|nr:hypothetical protein [Leptolyngbya sp.]
MKRPRTYWIQICFEDGQPDIWVESTEGYSETCVRAGRLLHISSGVRLGRTDWESSRLQAEEDVKLDNND